MVNLIELVMLLIEKHGAQWHRVYQGGLQYAAAHLIPFNRLEQGGKVAFTKT